MNEANLFLQKKSYILAKVFIIGFHFSLVNMGLKTKQGKERGPKGKFSVGENLVP
jgi:hypothetical protein